MRSELGLWVDAVVNATPAMANIRNAVEDEHMSKATLHVAQTNGLLPAEAVFIGGTALRLCYGSPRFSVDLDFHTPAGVPYKGFDGDLFAQEMGNFIGAKVHVSTPNTEGRSVLARISAELPERNRAVRWPRTNIDMARKSQLDASKTAVPLRIGSGTDSLGDLAAPVVLRVSSRDEIFVDKHMALVGRARRIKQRDVFDILWLRSQGAVFNADLLAAKLGDLDRENFVSMAIENCTLLTTENCTLLGEVA